MSMTNSIIKGKSGPDAGVEEDSLQHWSQLVLRFALEFRYNYVRDAIAS